MYLKTILFLFTLHVFLLNSQGQSMFSILHLNEERDVHKGVPWQIKETKTFYNSKKTEIKSEFTEYDTLGLPSTKRFFSEDGSPVSITYYKYDAVKRVLLEERRNELNVRFPTSHYKTLYQYEGAKSPVKIIHMDANGFVVAGAVIKNDSALGLPVELQLFDPAQTLAGIELAQYKPAENKAIVSVANTEGKIITTDTMKISFRNAHQFPDPDATYNDKGDVVSSQSKWRDGSMHYREYEYVYDEKGNWIEQKAYEVTYKAKGKKKRELKSHFTRNIVYWN